MKITLIDLYSFSIIIAAAIGWARFAKINPAYYPFLFLIWIGLLNEILGYFLIYSGHSNAINNNIYVLIESLLIAWQFEKWGLFEQSKWLYKSILSLFVLTWLIEILFIKGINLTISYFRIIYSFVIVLMSLNVINRQLLSEKKSIYKNAIFLICTIFVIYFLYKAIVGIFWLYGLGENHQFRMNVIWILIYVNLFANLMYALAVVWIPTKHRFSLPF